MADGRCVPPRTRTLLDGESRSRIHHSPDLIEQGAVRGRNRERRSFPPAGGARDVVSPASVGYLREWRIDSNVRGDLSWRTGYLRLAFKFKKSRGPGARAGVGRIRGMYRSTIRAAPGTFGGA